MKCRPSTTDGMLWDLVGPLGEIKKGGIPFDQITAHSTKGGHDIQRDLLRTLFVKGVITLDQLNLILFDRDAGPIPV
jgi:hypothetical protein